MKAPDFRMGVVALVLTTGTGLASGDEVAAPPDATMLTVRLSNPGAVSLPADRHRRVYIEFLFSPRLTAELRQALSRAGYIVANDKAAADVAYELDGAYQAFRPATGRTAEVRAGDYAEHSEALTTRTGTSVSVMVSLDPIATLIGTVMSNVGDRTGLRDAMNEAVSNDPDGKCLAKCEGWEYRQRAVVSVRRMEAGTTAKTSATSTAQARQLEAAALLGRAATELSRFSGLPSIAFSPASTP